MQTRWASPRQDWVKGKEDFGRVVRREMESWSLVEVAVRQSKCRVRASKCHKLRGREQRGRSQERHNWIYLQFTVNQPAELSMREPSNFASLVQRSRFTREVVRCGDRMWWFPDGGVSLGARAPSVRGGSPDQLLNFSTLQQNVLCWIFWIFLDNSWNLSKITTREATWFFTK